MKLWEVNWYVNVSNYNQLLSTSYYQTKNKRLFTSKEKAQELYKQLHDAAQLLNSSGLLNCTIDEVEIE